jgi:hypothetical protein
MPNEVDYCLYGVDADEMGSIEFSSSDNEEQELNFQH